MLKEWTDIIKVTGAVGVVGLLFSIFMDHFFSERIILVLGSDRTFYIVVTLVCLFFICLLTAILKRQDPRPSPKSKSLKSDITITYKDNSTHNGDNNF